MRIKTSTNPSLWVAIVMLGLAGCEKEPTTPTAPPPTQPAQGLAVPVVVLPAGQAAASNKDCPISGHAVVEGGQIAMYKDKAYGFCCDDCIKAFKDDPEKHASAH